MREWLDANPSPTGRELAEAGYVALISTEERMTVRIAAGSLAQGQDVAVLGLPRHAEPLRYEARPCCIVEADDDELGAAARPVAEEPGEALESGPAVAGPPRPEPS